MKPRNKIRVQSLLAVLVILGGAVLGSQMLPHGWVVHDAAGDPSNSFTFTSSGDHGWASETDASLNMLKSSGASFHLALGDLGYTSDAPGWCSYFKGSFSNIEFVTGNHDTDEDGPGALNGSQGYLANCPFTLSVPLTGAYGEEYYFDYPATNPSARFILIAPGIGGSEANFDYSSGSSHYNWVSNAIDDARNQGIPWVIVGSHKSCIYAGDKGSCDWTNELWNLMFAKKVDLILQAHAHYYERSKQLTCGFPDSYNPSCIVNEGADSLFTKGAGSIFVIDGTFGAGNRAIDTSSPLWPYMIKGQDSDYGFMRYTVTSTSLSGTFLSSTGAFTDSFTISGTSSPPQSNQPTTLPVSDLWILAGGGLTGALIGLVFFQTRFRRHREAAGSEERRAGSEQDSANISQPQSSRSGRRSRKRGPGSSHTKSRLAALLLCSTALLGAIAITSHIPHQALASPGSFTFTAAGDYGDDSPGSTAYSVISAVRASAPEFHLALGDLRYASLDPQSWCQNFRAQFNNIVFITGNHESGESDPGPTDQFAKDCPFQLSTTLVPGSDPAHSYGYEYAFDYPATNPLARFILISAGINWGCCNLTGTWDYSAGDPHYNWVSNTIDDARARGIPWVIVGMHKNGISPTGSFDISPDLSSLLFQKKVDLFLVGHDHSYDRSYQLSCGDPGGYVPSCVVNGNPTGYTKGAGTVYVITGTGGAGNTCGTPCGPDGPGTYFASSQGSDYGFMKYDLSASSLSAAYVSATGSFTDSFTIATGGLSASLAYNPTSPQVNNQVVFDAIARGGTPPYTYAWNFGDISSGTGATATHTYATAGSFIVALTVSDSSNRTITETQTITVFTILPLSVDFTYTPTSPVPGKQIIFTASPSGGTTPYNFIWDFGDQSNSTGENTQHNYTLAGTYTVTVALVDSLGNVTTRSKTITVDPTPPPQLLTRFQFSNPTGLDVTDEVSVQVWEGITLVATNNPVNLDPAKTYEVRIFFRSLQIGSADFTPRAIVSNTLYLYQHHSATDAYIAFNSSISSISITEETNRHLAFTASGSAPGYTIAAIVPKEPLYVLKDGANYTYTFDASRNLVVIETSSLSTWEIVFQSSPSPPEQPQPGDQNGQNGQGPCIICPSLPASMETSLFLLTMGGLVGMTSSLAILTLRARKRLQRARRSAKGTHGRTSSDENRTARWELDR